MNVMNLFSGGIYGDELLKIALSAIVGCIVGFEREVRRKPAGFRTLALICVGSTIFTICSYKLGVADNRDRIAANIITGVGFLGAGVIFKNGASVSGITTAATIWIAAALGMLIGIGEYGLMVVSVLVSIFVLYALQFIQDYIDNKFQHRDYVVNYKGLANADDIEQQLKTSKLKAYSFKETRQGEQSTFDFHLVGKEAQLEAFNDWLKTEVKVYSFTW